MAETSIFLAGNLTDDPELRYTPGGTARATFRVAVPSRVRDGEGWRDREPAFYAVVVWRDQAEHAAESLPKGSRAGRPTTGLPARWWRWWPTSWGASLSWATVATTRATRSPSS
jgi:hypothetical protein